jgi:DNA-binding winged helix-turn-helix (wHTH) protein/tetratricopeptide (TPR) repeat protein
MESGPIRHRVFRFGRFVFNDANQELSVDGARRKLESKPRALLAALLAQPNMVVTKKHLTDAVWPGKKAVDPRSLLTAIYNLRTALEPDGQAIIETVSGVGYKIAVPVDIGVVEVARHDLSSLQPGCPVAGRPQWRLERRLGVGAGNDVWLARHEKTPEARVFKFAATPERLDGLKWEAALSRHLYVKLGERADIVRVLEWNFQEQPYYIESLYGGPDLRAWFEARGGPASHSLAMRVAMVAQIARTVGDAHDAGVLHGDLKPANILVAEAEDATPATRLIDFGAGGLTPAARIEALTLTLRELADQGAGTTQGTFLYMAPEVMNGGPRTAAADIYAMGIILYQMITGNFDKTLSVGWEQHIDDPLLRQDVAEAAAGEVGQRLDSAKDLARRLETLDQRRADREAAAELQQQYAQRQAEHEQLMRTAELRRVEAVAATRLAHRTRGLAGALLVLFLLASGLAAYAWREQLVAMGQRDRANKVSAIAEDTVSGLIDDMAHGMAGHSMLTLDDLQKLLGRAEATIKAMTHLASDAPQLRQLEARALTKFAETYLHQGDLTRALASGQRAASLQRDLLASDPGNVQLKIELAESERWIGDAALKQDDLAGAMAAYRTSLDIYQQLALADPKKADFQLQLARAYGWVGYAQSAQHDDEAALLTYQRALAIIKAGLDANRGNVEWQSELSMTEENIGDALETLNRPREALAAYQAEKAIREKLYQLDTKNMRWQRDLTVATVDVGDAFKDLNDLNSALAAYKAALQLDTERTSYDPARAEWQRDLAVSNTDVAETMAALGDRNGAMPYYLASLSILQALTKKDPSDEGFASDVAQIEIEIADNLIRLRDYPRARPYILLARDLVHKLVAQYPKDKDLFAGIKEVDDMARTAGITK